MNGSSWTRRPLVLVVAVASVLWALAAGLSAATVSLQLGREGLDLDTATIVGSDDPASRDVELWFLYNTEREEPIVLLPNLGGQVEMALLEARPYDSVTAADVEAASFVAEFPDRGLGSDDTVLLRTATGAVFKVGEVVLESDAVRFSYEQMPQ